MPFGGDGTFSSLVNLTQRIQFARNGAGRQEGKESTFYLNPQREYIANRDRHGMCLCPVPTGTSNTWCSEFLYSEGGERAGNRYVADAMQQARNLLSKLKGHPDCPEALRSGDLTIELCEETANGIKLSGLKEILDKYILKRTKGYSKIMKITKKTFCWGTKKNSNIQNEEKFKEQEKTLYSLKEKAEKWDQVKGVRKEKVSFRAEGLAAAARAVRRHFSAAAAAVERRIREERTAAAIFPEEGEKTKSRLITKMNQMIYCFKSALEIEEKLLRPKAAEKDKQEKETKKSFNQMAKDLSDQIKQLVSLAKFCKKVGPGKDSKTSRHGVKNILNFWSRVSSNGTRSSKGSSSVAVVVAE